ncbi:hypothetical protein HO173_006006 [Letharia columbiana]|uniref:Diphthine--ammonia ligase n=1 Tax=Letharia columbiana TaxID=112416 RepID=A0A8H6FVZ9_9LECA|nr:uncharacterized protein HO173_006006 [Letharia columbiana]KAF6235811.1 hypothetical protein HO173_006006 [Letharia columbiana]
MGDNPKSLTVIGLISGGKDSFFSVLHCLANNHRVVALANLYPPQALSLGGISEDLNSYMYQTAGHRLTPLYSDALGLPVFRQEISGSALNPSKVYEYAGDNQQDSQRVDETEDLMELLRRILQQYPHVNAVCSGAILSTYQRTRIESVARRLNLVPLSYLWQYPSLPPPSAGGLLDDMAAVGLDVRIVKVASGGLEEELLWQNLMDRKVRARVEKGMRRFGGSVLGEGGEYETLVVNGPMGVFRKNIVVDDQEMWIEKGGGGEAWLAFREHAGTMVTNDDSEPSDGQEWKTLLRTIGLWDGEFEELYHHLRGKIPFITGQANPHIVTGQTKAKNPRKIPTRWEVKPVVFRTQAMLTISNMTSRGPNTIATDQMSDINSRILEFLTENDRSTDDIIFTTMLLRSMADFPGLNSIYGQLFKRPNPPARVTVACGESLPDEVSVMVSFVVNLGALAAREGLHIQSRSYWAPANIGPYSQAISVPTNTEHGSAIVYLAGQIPLVPASMEVLQVEDGNKQMDSENENEMDSFSKRACLALQHLWRIGKTMNVSWWTGGIAFISGKSDVRMKAIIAWEIWKGVHQKELWEKDGVEEDGLDAWDKKYGGLGSFMKDEVEVQSLPDIARLSISPFVGPPGFFAVQVDELPRGCNIEWQALGVTNPYVDIVSYATISLTSSDEEFRTVLLATVEGCRPQLQQATVYTQRTALLSGLSMQVFPCSAVYGPEGEEVAAGIVLQQA